MVISKKNIMLVILSVILAVLGGCVEKEPLDDELTPLSEEDPSEQRKIVAYFPVIPGMRYTFEGEGNEYASFTREIKYVKDVYAQIHENNGGTINAAVYKIEDDKVTRVIQEGEFYSDTNLIQNIDETQEKAEVILKAPLREGTHWESDEWKREITGVDQILSVPAGTFYNVIKVKINSLQQENPTEMYEYYAENVGLIAREFQSDDYKVTSRLKTYGMGTAQAPEPQQMIAEEESILPVAIMNPDLPLLAYQLEHQLRSAFQAAFESYTNLNAMVQPAGQYFEQILKTYWQNLSSLAVDSLVDVHLERLRQYYQAGEDEVTFPTHEVIKQVKLLARADQRAKVSIELHKFYPAREGSGKAFDRVVDYIVTLVMVKGQWKVEKVEVAE